ncbi:MAG: threonine synthase [Syntrophotalea acetylenica]|jgi:threonine synthase|uniref:Threonine synthase n=1 Tax=Syntrophotalea acetylenica TaxID=29542 RepID=A0A1L3GJ17_SYNAC|nr:threonine synthase [Syntrophotalea acetylenica]APG25927.1 threonine synthase [Syntrophotalea acetylenica]APG43997.1 threonine synthase [Syntrophotalea acetylenica]MDD4456763.1 threonine synthase [Syntrophotalea acetylenica]
MQYMSTRGRISGLDFKDAVMMGLADDGGLLLPQQIPALSRGDIAALTRMAYPDLAFRIISLFAGSIPAADLKHLIDRSYQAFDHDEVTPVVHKDGIYVLELFHGPTLAFKDVALQFLGNMFEYLLKERGAHMNILGATSGDTGSAAIYGVRGKQNINIFILHPHQRVSPIQELQMTTVTDPNVFNLAIRGTFDDGQRIVKEIFGDLAFKSRMALGAINSINWARVLAQVVYYFYAFGRVQRATSCEEVYFSVPTGNFGDIFAGYIAKRMGLPIRRLILATNENDILTRFINQGDYSTAQVVPTPSPSMDIQLASNFERYLFYLYGQNPGRVNDAMSRLAATGRLEFTAEELACVGRDFMAGSATRQETLDTIRAFHAATGYILDPHTAVGVKVGKELTGGEVPLVCLATAHPAKFGDAVREAIGQDPVLPPVFRDLDKKEKRCELIDADTGSVREYLQKNALA